VGELDSFTSRRNGLSPLHVAFVTTYPSVQWVPENLACEQSHRIVKLICSFHSKTEVKERDVLSHLFHVFVKGHFSKHRDTLISSFSPYLILQTTRKHDKLAVWK